MVVINALLFGIINMSKARNMYNIKSVQAQPTKHNPVTETQRKKLLQINAADLLKKICGTNRHSSIKTSK
jgi:hypothetical protein